MSTNETEITENQENNYEGMKELKDFSTASVFSILLKAANNRPTPQGIFMKILLGLNTIFSASFEALLYYYIDENSGPIPKSVSLITKIILIIIIYCIMNIAAAIMYITIPIYFTIYTKNFNNFKSFLMMTFKKYENNPSKQYLASINDDNTKWILQNYSTIITKFDNDIKNMDNYKNYINTVIKIPDVQITNYLLSLPDEYDTYIKNKQKYMFEALQYWIVMICCITFVITIRYIPTKILPVSPINKVQNGLTDIGAVAAANTAMKAAKNVQTAATTATKNLSNSPPAQTQSGTIANPPPS